MSKSIQVFNPCSHKPRYVTKKTADRLCKRGKAFMRPDGQIQFRKFIERNVFRTIEAASEEAKEFKKNRGRVVWWNGDSSDPGAMYPPGVRRS